MSKPDSDSHLLEAQVREIADTKAVEVGFEPEDCQPKVFRELRPDDRLFLDHEGPTSVIPFGRSTTSHPLCSSTKVSYLALSVEI